jgi:putative transposase
VTYINENRARFGVEPICKVLQVAPATYYAATTRKPSIRALHDDVLKEEITRVWHANREVYGAYKVWRQLQREGWQVARCTVERLMRDLGLGHVPSSGVRAARSILMTFESFRRLLAVLAPPHWSVGARSR